MKKLFSIFGHAMCAVILLAACNDDNNAAANQNLISVGKQGKIILSVQKYGEDKEITRTAQIPTKPQIVDLGDGMLAEITVKKERSEDIPVTRATDIQDGHFSIYALNTATNVRVGSVLKGTLSSEWVSKPTPSEPWAGEYVTEFTPDAGSDLYLPSGTYKFVCYNDAVIDDGTQLSVVNSTVPPLIGTTTGKISDNGFSLEFEMKHPAARVKFQVNSLLGDNNDGTFTMPAKFSLASPTLKEIKYAPDITSSVKIAGIGTPVATDLKGAGYDYNFHYEYLFSDYLYMCPNDGANIKFEFTDGTCYRKSLAGLKTALTAMGSLVANGSYIFTFRIMPSFVYLFNDGTTGYLKDKGSRTPIGIVLRKKEGSTKGLAAALKYADTSGIHITSFSSNIGNKQNFPDIKDAIKDMNGYANTWDANTSRNNVVKANSADYPGFQAAANYNPGVPTSGIGKWFLPSLGQIELLAYNVGFAVKNTNYQMLSYSDPVYKYAFAKAGGDYIGTLVSSTERSPYSWWYYWGNATNGFYDTTSSGNILPFVEF